MKNNGGENPFEGNADRRVAYFSMEVGIQSDIPTYSGGLGVLAGDTIKAFADLHVPAVAVTLLYRNGYFRQAIDGRGNQQEFPVHWNPLYHLKRLAPKTTVTLNGRTVILQAWQYVCTGNDGFPVPVLFLDAAVAGNHEYDRHINDYLYGGDDEYRLTQEAVLGIGGIRMLKALGFSGIERYHMNEGHSSLLALELLRRRAGRERHSWNLQKVRDLCVFTTHTPVPAGHDKFSYDLVNTVLGDYLPADLLRRVGGNEALNMTLLALNLSHYINGVAEQHTKVSRQMFPGYAIDAVTNGIHTASWAHRSFRRLFSEYIPQWKKDPSSLRYALNIPVKNIGRSHQEAKRELLSYVRNETGVSLNENVLTIGFARRATAYKRMDLIFHDIGRLKGIAGRAGKIQIIYSGKAHPRDQAGREMIREVCAMADILKSHIPIAYIQDYDMAKAYKIVSGVDVWLNTPRKPQEASGTSGMKAALNGVPSLSILDGWWLEGCIEGITGWAIGTRSEKDNNNATDARSLYSKLEDTIIPLFYHKKDEWAGIMRSAIAINGSFFNAHRMVLEYVLNAYYLTQIQTRPAVPGDAFTAKATVS